MRLMKYNRQVNSHIHLQGQIRATLGSLVEIANREVLRSESYSDLITSPLIKFLIG